MTEDVAEFLLAPPGRDLIAQAAALRADRAETLAALTRLRKAATPEQAAAAWEMADLRHRAAAKFGADAARMYFVREALEQASSRAASEYHARRFVQAGVRSVTDLCGGVGGDALAFARAGLRVTLAEQDPVRARFAAENARACGLDDHLQVLNADVTALVLETDAAWFDPARRTDSRRAVDPEDYAPPLVFLRAVQAQGVEHVGVKLAPAIEHAVAATYRAELEFLSDGGECKEALLWRGAPQTGAALAATVLTGDGPQTLVGTPEAAPTAADVNAAYLYEPDPAVIRAHLVGTLAAQLGAAALDPQIAYLVGGVLRETPFATPYQILENFPYGRKRLQEALSARQVGRVIIKKRGFPQEPEAVRAGLKLRGPHEMIVVLTRLGKQHWVFLCRRIDVG